MRKAVFSSYVSLTASILRLFPLDALAQQGFPVEYWDMSALFGASLPSKEIARPYTRRFTTWAGLESALLAPEAAELMIIVAAPYEPRFFRLHRLLSRSPAALGSVISGALPMPDRSPLGRGRADLRLLLDPAKVAHFVLKRAAQAARRLGAVREFDFVFAAGSAAKEEAGRAPVIAVNSADYDEWLATEAADPPLVEGRYAVYLDQFAPAHPDFALLGIKKLINPDRYYALLNGFFERLERSCGVAVVIAAHPKADYPRNPFAGRRILSSSTSALVRRCEFALATISTSIGFAVLDRKPIVFFTTEDMMARYRPLRHDTAPFRFAKALGRPCLVLDRLPQQEMRIDAVDASLYDDYKYRYLASRETEGRHSSAVYREFFSSRGLAPVRRA